MFRCQCNVKNAENANRGGTVLQEEKVGPCFGFQLLLTKPMSWDMSVSSRDHLTATFNKEGEHSSLLLAKHHSFVRAFHNLCAFPHRNALSTHKEGI